MNRLPQGTRDRSRREFSSTVRQVVGFSGGRLTASRLILPSFCAICQPHASTVPHSTGWGSARPRVCSAGMSDVTRLLDAAARGDPQAADRLLPLVYDELRQLAAARLAAEKLGQT